MQAFFSETHRVLKPNGRAIVSAMHPAMFLRGSQGGVMQHDQRTCHPHGMPWLIRHLTTTMNFRRFDFRGR
ncbi:MAG: hypothetical protein GXP24_14685 [Planctomycetes bacterium]|nr:hypothetical protein [Planctomycetota bacterium]